MIPATDVDVASVVDPCDVSVPLDIASFHPISADSGLDVAPSAGLDPSHASSAVPVVDALVLALSSIFLYFFIKWLLYFLVGR